MKNQKAPIVLQITSKLKQCNLVYFVILSYIEYFGVKECLKIVDEQLAIGFETERYAFLKGATMEVFKFKHIATRLDTEKFYIASSEITQGNLEIENDSKVI